MTLPRRRRPIGPERQSIVNNAMVPGSFPNGRSVPNVAPVYGKKRIDARARGITAVTDITSRSSKIDQFTLGASGAQDLTLTYLPILDSQNVSIRSLACYLTDDYTISGQTLSLTTGKAPVTGDKVQVQYDYLTGTPATVIASGQYPLEVMLDGPIAYWRLDEASGTSVADYTGHGHTGTTNNGPSPGLVTRAQTTLLTAPNGGVRSTKFFEYGARVDVPTSTAFDTSAFTIEFFTSKGASTLCPVWHHPGRMRVLMAGSAIDVFFWNSGAWVHKWRFSGLIGSDDAVNHHVVITYDGTTMKLYMEGSLDAGTSMGSPTLPSATAGPQFGDGADLTNNGSAFRLQEFAVYDHALSAARVAAHVAVR